MMIMATTTMTTTTFHRLLRWEMIILPILIHLYIIFSSKKVGRMYFLNVGVKGLKKNGSIVAFHLSNLWKARFSILCNDYISVGAAGKFGNWSPLGVKWLNSSASLLRSEPTRANGLKRELLQFRRGSAPQSRETYIAPNHRISHSATASRVNLPPHRHYILPK